MGEVLLIINSKSGVDRKKDGLISAISESLASRGETLDVAYTSRPGDARSFAEEGAQDKKRLVIVAGGDGTINDAASGLWGSETALAIVPVGSGNGLARSLCIPQEIDKAIKIALDGRRAAIDRGAVNGKHFYCAFGTGFDAEVSYKFSLDPRRGRMTYIKYAIKELFTYRPRHFRISTDETEVETDAMLVAVCNCRQYGNNAYIAPGADASDGVLDVTVVHSGNFFAKAVAGFDLLSGCLDKNVLVEMFRVKRAVIETDREGLMHLDGEPSEAPKVMDIQCESGGLNIMVPVSCEQFRPFISPMKSMWGDLVLDIKKVSGKNLK